MLVNAILLDAAFKMMQGASTFVIHHAIIIGILISVEFNWL